jgi:hypothetical protein
MARRKLRICWPKPDDVCVEGGCAHCGDAELMPVREILNSLTAKQKDVLYDRLRNNFNLR